MRPGIGQETIKGFQPDPAIEFEEFLLGSQALKHCGRGPISQYCELHTRFTQDYWRLSV